MRLKQDPMHLIRYMGFRLLLARDLALRMGTTLFTSLRRGFALATRLRAFIIGAAAGLGENAILLHLTVEFFEGQLERVARIQFDLCHVDYQRDLRPVERPLPELCV